MIEIRNKLNQRLIINLSGGKNIDLLAKGTMRVSEKELSSPHLQALITRGDVRVIRESESKESKESRLEEAKSETKEPKEVQMEEAKEVIKHVVKKQVEDKKKSKK